MPAQARRRAKTQALDYRFVCMDRNGRSQAVTMVSLSSDLDAEDHGRRLLDDFPVVIVWQEDRQISVFARLA